MPCKTAGVEQEKKKEGKKIFSSQRGQNWEAIQFDGESDSSSKVSRLSGSALQPQGLRSGLEGTVACQDTSYIPWVVEQQFMGLCRCQTAGKYCCAHPVKFTASINPWHLLRLCRSLWTLGVSYSASHRLVVLLWDLLFMECL